MTVPSTSFPWATPRHALPYLYPGQSQKELFVNQASTMIDVLLHPAVAGEANDPPGAPEPGETWLVGANPAAEWAGQAGALAAYADGQWLFFPPRDGLRIFDRATRQFLHYSGQWVRVAAPPPPSGGTVVDVEARALLATLIEIMASTGVFPPN